eukprot:scaffold65101_cov52-Phaeocystis_antarctica.AAC.2
MTNAQMKKTDFAKTEEEKKAKTAPLLALDALQRRAVGQVSLEAVEGGRDVQVELGDLRLIGSAAHLGAEADVGARARLVGQSVVEDAVVLVAVLLGRHADVHLELPIPCEHRVAAPEGVASVGVPSGLAAELAVACELHVERRQHEAARDVRAAVREGHCHARPPRHAALQRDGQPAAAADGARRPGLDASGGRDRDRGDARAARRQDVQRGVAHVDGDGPRRHGLHDREARGGERGVLAAHGGRQQQPVCEGRHLARLKLAAGRRHPLRPARVLPLVVRPRLGEAHQLEGGGGAARLAHLTVGLHADAALGHHEQHGARAAHPSRAHPAALAADGGVHHRAVTREVGQGALPPPMLGGHRIEDHRRAPRTDLDGGRTSVAQHEAHPQPFAIGVPLVVPLEAERERGRRGQRRAEVRSCQLAGRCGEGRCFGSLFSSRRERGKRRVHADDTHAHRDVTEVVRAPEARGIGHEVEAPTHQVCRRYRERLD